jgi:hypothetical protein
MPGPFYDDVAQLVARSKIYATPTYHPNADPVSYFKLAASPHDDPKLRRFMPESVLDQFRRQPIAPEDEWDWLVNSKSYAKISKAGGNVAFGSHGDNQGVGAQWELWVMQRGGISNHQALRQATLMPAEKIGYAQDLGSLEVGKLADFLVLHANPLDDIKNSAKIQYVVKAGIVYDGESMATLWPKRATLNRFNWQTPEEMRRWAAPRPSEIR